MNRDEVVEIFEVDTFVFNNLSYSEIHISLNHINYDKSGNKRSDLKAEGVIELFVEEINGKIIEPDGIKNNFVFYVHTFFGKDGKKYKVAFSTQEEMVFIRIITLYRKR
jgi:hypothetical protein